MSDTFTALVLRETDDGPVGALEQLTDADLPEGDVTIDVDYSSLNYKDGMALAGKGRIVRSYPMVPGIDLTGTVVASDSPDFAVGDAVISTGWSVGERYWGGYTQRQRVRSEWLVKRPDGYERADRDVDRHRRADRDALRDGHRRRRGDCPPTARCS